VNGAVATLNLALLGLLLAAICWAWSAAMRRLWNRQPLLDWEPRRAVPWGLVDLLLLAALFVFIQIVGAGVARRLDNIPDNLPADQVLTRPAVHLVSAAGHGVWLVIAGIWLVMLRGARAADLGVSLRGFLSDVLLGVAVFLLLAPPMYALQFVLVQWWPSHHPLVEILKQHS
jgi:hypothetical protein